MESDDPQPRPVKRGSPEWWARVDAHLVDIRGRIAEFGFVIQPVFGRSAGDVSFAYTIGLTEQGRPELVCLGPTCEGCAWLLTGVAKLGPTGDEVTLTLPAIAEVPPLVLRLRPVDPSADGYPLNMATRIYGRDLVTALQVLWPHETSGAYPGEPGWEDVPHGPQPLLPLPGRR